MWGKIINILKIIGILIGSVGILFGAFKFIDQSKRTAEGQIKTDQKVDNLVVSFDEFKTEVKNSLTEIKFEVTAGQKRQETLQKSYIDYVRKNTQNSEDLYNILKDFIDIKKNNGEIGFIEIPLRPSMIPYNSILLSKK